MFFIEILPNGGSPAPRGEDKPVNPAAAATGAELDRPAEAATGAREPQSDAGAPANPQDAAEAGQ